MGVKQGLGFVGLVVLLCSVPVGLIPLGASEDPGLAAPLPSPVFAVSAVSVEEEYVFFDRERDLALMSEAFNAVAVSAGPWLNGDLSLVSAVRDAGMAAIIRFDWTRQYIAGSDLSEGIDRIVAVTKANPGMIAGIHIADELNYAADLGGLLTPEQMVGYLAATAGRFHQELPGVPVLVDVIDWELTCGLSQQPACEEGVNCERCRYETDAVLAELYETGYLDGFSLSFPLRGFRADVAETAMRRARAMFPEPFLLIAGTAQLSFPDQEFSGTRADAQMMVESWWHATLRGGADGVGLWGWHRPDGAGRLRTFLNKDGTTNPLWEALTAAKALAGDNGVPTSSSAASSTDPNGTTVVTDPENDQSDLGRDNGLQGTQLIAGSLLLVLLVIALFQIRRFRARGNE